ncbi:MAG: hypothetical protein WC956_05025 [bacterium]
MIRLMPVDGGEEIGCSSAKAWLLFLASHRGEIRLTETLEQGALPYGIIMRKGGRIVGIALRVDANMNGAAQSMLRDGSSICVGRQRFSVRLTRTGPRSLRAVMSRRILSMLAVAALLAICSIAILHLRPAMDMHAQKDSEVKTGEETAHGADGLIEEARLHLRAGRTEQARLALMEAAERDPGGEAAPMLKALEGGTVQPADDERSAADQETGARALFDSGREQMSSGDATGAYRKFVMAEARIKEMGSEPPFANALKEKLLEARAQLEREVSSQIEQVDRTIKGARSMDSEAAVAELGKAVAATRAAVKLLPESRELASCAARASGELAAAAARWLASALAAERLSGCEKALPIYDRISRALATAGEPRAQEAAGRAAICRQSLEQKR